MGSIVKVVEKAEEDTRKRRSAEWLSYIQAFAARLEAELAADTDGQVRSTLLESTRAAADAVDEVVLPSIGRLTRKRFTTKTPDLRTYRHVLGILRTLDGEEFTALRSAFHKLSALEGDPLTTFIIEDTGPEIVAAAGSTSDRAWNWYCVNSKPATVLVLGDVAARLVMALAPIIGSYNPAEPERPRNKPRISRSIIDLFVEIMPIDS